MADTVLASATLVLRRRSSGAKIVLDPALEIGAGGEARVLRVPGEDGLVAKLYHEPTVARAAKLARMMEAPPALQGGVTLAWPVDLLTDPSGRRFAGFLMPRAEGPRIFEFYNPVSRRRTAPLFDWGRLHRAGMGLAAAFDALHGCGYVVGDVNESNILLSPEDASVTLVDADSFQARDPRTGAIYRSGVGKAEFTPPELQGTHFADIDRGPEHDRFGLAVLLFLLLMEGTHPFAQRFEEGDAEVLPVEERIRRGLYPHAAADDACRPPRMSPPIQTLHPGLQALFLRCFVQGHTDPAARPTAAEWRDALALAEGELRPCGENPRHLFASHIAFCPWCHRARLLQGRDPFPVSLELARAADPAPARRPISAGPRTAPAPVTTPAPFAAPLPQWMTGPTALGNPVAWLPAALLALTPDTPTGVRLLLLGLGLVSVLLSRLYARRAGLAAPPFRFNRLTGMWMVALVFLWLILTGIAQGSSAAADVQQSPAVPAPVRQAPDPPAAVAPAPPEPGPPLPVYELSEVDVDPELENPVEVNRVLAAGYPALLRDARVTGRVTVGFTVDTLGATNSEPMWVSRSTHGAFVMPALDAVKVMRFRPARKDGRKVPVRMQLPLAFTLPRAS